MAFAGGFMLRSLLLRASLCRTNVRKSFVRAVSSAVERFVYTEDVGGSIPSPPTIVSPVPHGPAPAHLTLH